MLVTSSLRRRIVCCNGFMIDDMVQWERSRWKSDLSYLESALKYILLERFSFIRNNRYSEWDIIDAALTIRTWKKIKNIFVFLIFQCFCIFQIFSWNKTLVEFNSEEIDSIYFKNKLREKFRTKNSKQAFLYKNFQNPNQYKHLFKNENQMSFLFSSIIVRVNYCTWSMV